jgi:hypothetical protein
VCEEYFCVRIYAGSEGLSSERFLRVNEMLREENIFVSDDD